MKKSLEHLLQNPPKSLSAFLHSQVARYELKRSLHSAIRGRPEHPNILKIKRLLVEVIQGQSVQALRAKKSRGKLPSGKTIRELVEELVARLDYTDYRPQELWPLLYSSLRDNDGEPSVARKADHAGYQYERLDNKTSIITYKAFVRILRNARLTRSRSPVKSRRAVMTDL